MRVFIHKYRSVILFLVFTHAFALVFQPIAWLITALYFTWLLISKKHEYAILLLLVILIMGDSREWYFGYFKNMRIVGMLILAIYTFGKFLSQEYIPNRLFLFTLPFFGVAFVASFRHPQIGLSISKMLSYLFLLVVIFHYVPEQLKKNNRLIGDFATLGIIILLIGLILSQLFPSIAYLIGRYRGLLGNPNGLGIYCTLLFPMLLICIEWFPDKRKLWRLGMILLIISAIYANSRTALGSISIFYFLHWFYRRPGRMAPIMLWGVVVPAMALFLSGSSLIQLIQGVGLGEYLRVESIATGTGRFLAWGLGFTKILEAPFIGRGFAFEEWYFHSLEEFLITTEHQGGMHNSYLTFIMNTGFIGFFFFLIFFFALLSSMKPRAYVMPISVMVIFSAGFESWLTSSLNAFSIHFYLLAIILINWNQLAPKRLGTAQRKT